MLMLKITLRWWRMKVKNIITVLLITVVVFSNSQAFAIQSERNSIVFLFDASASMNENDPDRLAIDSIAQLIYSLPSNYDVGVVAYNNDVVLKTEMASPEGRTSIIKDAEMIEYQGFTNAGDGLKASMELLQGKSNKKIVMLSDGEILMENLELTEKSIDTFESEVNMAKKNDVSIHVIGLGNEIEDIKESIFTSATKTGGSQHHAPKALDIQKAIDSIISDDFGIKKSTLAVVESDGTLQNINITLPSKNMSKAIILLTSTKPITGLVADFNANTSMQSSGLRYAVIELENPAEQEINITLQSEKSSKIKVDVISEYNIDPMIDIEYEDIEPEDKNATYYDRTATVKLSFVDSDNKNICVLTDDYFNNIPILIDIDGEINEYPIINGEVIYEVLASENTTQKISVNYSKLPITVFGNDTISIDLKEPPLLPKKKYIIPIIIGGLALLILVVFLIIKLIQSRRKVISLTTQEVQELSKFSYAGKLNIYITRTSTGMDIAPLSFNLFRLSSGRTVCLNEILSDLGVKEIFEGAERILLKPGVNRSLILNNQSDCTIIKNREILMKNKSYELILDSKIDISFEDGKSEITFQYKDVKLSRV